MKHCCLSLNHPDALLRIFGLRREWQYRPVIPALRKLRQGDHRFKASLDYRANSRPTLGSEQ
jgi:hypothetical protein